ncbi:MAG: alpha/beta hydrolase [Planctomycetota bacterium]
MELPFSSRGFGAALWLVGVLALLPACTAPVQVTTLDSHGRPDLTPHYEYRPVDLADRLQHPELLESLRAARRVENVLPELAAERYLESARLAYGVILDPQTPDQDRALIITEFYNRAVAGYIRCAPPNQDSDLVVIAEGEHRWPDPLYFDSYSPSADIRIQGLRQHHVDRGIGAPLIASRTTDEREGVEALYPLEGVVWPLTAVLRFDSPQPTLDLIDPRQTDRVRLGRPYGADASSATDEANTEFPLAADFSAPYAELLSRTQELASLGFAGMLDPTKGEDRLGIYLLEPYDPDKTPLLMIHGLMSTPLTWIELTNEIQADPELRNRYQVWHFAYPTATCPFYSAYMLRQKLASTRELLDPELDDFASQDVIVIGHSMGGILTRTLVSDTGMDAWEVAFTVPPEELEGDPAMVEFLRNVYIYESLPYINRVVFVATPHRGANLADDLIGAFGNSLIKLPAFCIESTKEIARVNRDKLQPGYGRWMVNGPPSSIQVLSPDSPASEAPDLIPIRDGVAFHSIIGTRTPLAEEDDPVGTSDGIVDYWSSHLDGAETETFVPAGHNAHDHPDAVAELKRILHEHVGTNTEVAQLTSGR